MKRQPLGILTVTAFLLVASATPAVAATPPGSMASAGDSITRAFDVNGSHFLSDAPAESWSTGSDPVVISEAARLRLQNPALTATNVAKTGAKMSALDSQLAAAAAQHVQYVTVLMGANDVCTSSVGTMTPTATFHDQFSTALAHFVAADPGATVQVASIPNIYQLWNVLHTNRSARTAWALYGVCKSMLASTATEAQRQAVLAQERADNDVLASVCGATTGCRWDGGAAFGVTFSAAQISTVDYFHPSVSGQALLAATEWKASPYFVG